MFAVSYLRLSCHSCMADLQIFLLPSVWELISDNICGAFGTGGLFPLATSLAGTWRALQDPLSSNWGEEIPLIIIAKCSWRLMLLHINVVTELCWAWGQARIFQFRRPVSVNMCCVRTCPQVCCSIVVVCVGLSPSFSQLWKSKRFTSAACCWQMPSGCRVLSLWLATCWLVEPAECI